MSLKRSVNNFATIEQTLTGDRDAILAAIDRLPTGRADGMRLDKAFQTGAKALWEDLRKIENTSVMILLTDGRPNRVPLDEASGEVQETRS